MGAASASAAIPDTITQGGRAFETPYKGLRQGLRRRKACYNPHRATYTRPVPVPAPARPLFGCQRPQLTVVNIQPDVVDVKGF